MYASHELAASRWLRLTATQRRRTALGVTLWLSPVRRQAHSLPGSTRSRAFSCCITLAEARCYAVAARLAVTLRLSRAHSIASALAQRAQLRIRLLHHAGRTAAQRLRTTQGLRTRCHASAAVGAHASAAVGARAITFAPRQRTQLRFCLLHHAGCGSPLHSGGALNLLGCRRCTFNHVCSQAARTQPRIRFLHHAGCGSPASSGCALDVTLRHHPSGSLSPTYVLLGYNLSALATSWRRAIGRDTLPDTLARPQRLASSRAHMPDAGCETSQS
jgi:hypothetical protein